MHTPKRYYRLSGLALSLGTIIVCVAMKAPDVVYLPVGALGSAFLGTYFFKPK